MNLPPTILYERRGPVAVVTINRPQALNALTSDMLRGIDAAFAGFDADPELRVAILTGAGEKSFCAGMDLKEAIPQVTAGDMIGYDDPTRRPLSDIRKPIIAAVNGLCVAGGLEILQGTDLRVASENASFGLAEVRWGLVPSGGSHIRLPRQIPLAVAMEILLTGASIDARRAYDIGLVNRVVPLGELMPAAIELAEKVAANGPLAVRTAKEIVLRSFALEQGFVLERALAARVFTSEDAREGPRAFAERRPPKFTGR